MGTENQRDDPGCPRSPRTSATAVYHVPVDDVPYLAALGARYKATVQRGECRWHGTGNIGGLKVGRLARMAVQGSCRPIANDAS